MLIHKSQIGFMDERGRLKRVVCAFTPKITGSQTSQLVVNQRQKRIERVLSPFTIRN
jgi:hypothetical protein